MKFRLGWPAVLMFGFLICLAPAYGTPAPKSGCTNVKSNELCDQFTKTDQYLTCVNKLMEAMQRDRSAYIQQCSSAAAGANGDNNKAAEEKQEEVQAAVEDASKRGPAASIGLPKIADAAQDVSDPGKHAVVLAEEKCAEMQRELANCGDLAKGKASKASGTIESEVKSGREYIQQTIDSQIGPAISGLGKENTGSDAVNANGSDSP